MSLEWSLVLAELPPRVKQEVLSLSDTVTLLQTSLAAAERERDEAQTWAKEFKRIARAVWAEDWESDDIDKLFDHWPTLSDWLKEKP